MVQMIQPVVPKQRDVNSAGRPALLPSLTGMRFIAAAMVFFFHSIWLWITLFESPAAGAKYMSIFLQGGWAGVSFFFILSGFVLTWAVRPNDSAPTFWRRRFFKVYPNHLVTFIAAFILIGTSSKIAIDGWDAVANVFLVHALFPQMEIRSNYNPVAWSLSCEALFYLSFPLIIWLIGRIRTERLWAWTIGSVAAIFAIPVVAKLLPASPPFPVTGFTKWEMWFVFQFPPVRMLEFIFGILLARLVLAGKKMPVGLGGAIALSVATYALAPMFPATWTFTAVMVVPLGLVIAAGAVADVERRPTLLSTPLMVKLGEISFAFYMCHYLILMYSYQWFSEGKSWSTPAAIGILALLFGTTLIVSWLMYTLVERPIMRRFATSRRRRTDRPTIDTDASQDSRMVVTQGARSE